MTNHTKIYRMVTDTHMVELNKLIRSRGSTVDNVHEWLMDRGYEVSRTATHRYMQKVKRGQADFSCESKADRTVHERQIVFCAKSLSLDGVAILAMFASFLAGMPVEGQINGVRRS